MFIAAKFLAFVTQPLAWLGLAMLAALLWVPTHARRSQGLLASALVFLLLLGWQPLPDALLRQLEAQYSAPSARASLNQYVGVVVLGGALEPAYVWRVDGQSALNDAAERMTEVLPLLRRQAKLQVLFSGGEGEWLSQGASESERARRFFQSQGIAADQVQYEAVSRTTYENALLSKQLPGIDARQPWLLLTSAWHMPRAMATFRHAGWNVTAYPVDFRAGAQTPLSQFSMDQGVQKWHIALHEMLGLLVYRLFGRA